MTCEFSKGKKSLNPGNSMNSPFPGFHAPARPSSRTVVLGGCYYAGLCWLKKEERRIFNGVGFTRLSFHLNLSYFRHTNTRPRTFFNRIGSWTLNQFLAFLGKCANRKTKTHKTQKCIGPRSISTPSYTFYMFVPIPLSFLETETPKQTEKKLEIFLPLKGPFQKPTW